MTGGVEVEVVAVELDVAGVVEVEVCAVELVEDETGGPEVVTPVVLTPVVVPAVVLLEDLQADASGIDAKAVPAATMPALFRNCRLVNLVTRKISSLPSNILSFVFRHIHSPFYLESSKLSSGMNATIQRYVRVYDSVLFDATSNIMYCQ